MAKPKKSSSARVALKLSKLTVAQKAAQMNSLADAYDANPALFPSPPVTSAQLRVGALALLSKEKSAKDARQAAIVATSERDDAENAADASLTQSADFVQLVSKGDSTVITKSSLEVKGAPVRMKSVPAAPQNLSASSGTKLGEAKLKYTKPAGTQTFTVQHTATPTDEGSWKTFLSTQKTTPLVAGVPSGKMWFRVAASGAQGQGPWSDPATCIVP